MEKLAHWIEKILLGVGVTEGMAPFLRLLILLTVMGVLAWLSLGLHV